MWKILETVATLVFFRKSVWRQPLIRGSSQTHPRRLIFGKPQLSMINKVMASAVLIKLHRLMSTHVSQRDIPLSIYSSPDEIKPNESYFYGLGWLILLFCFYSMMTASYGKIFRVTEPLWGGFYSQKPVTRSFDIFYDLHLNKQLSKQATRWGLRCHRAHYDVTVMQ